MSPLFVVEQRTSLELGASTASFAKRLCCTETVIWASAVDPPVAALFPALGII